MIKKSGSAKWTGNLKEGKGHVSTQTGVISDQPYGFNTRFEGKDGTNPEAVSYTHLTLPTILLV